MGVSQSSNIEQEKQINEKEELYEHVLRIRLYDLERLHIFFQQKKQHITAEDRYLWYYFLCQNPISTNIEIVDNQITNISQEKLEATMRFVNYMYDIGWAEHFDRQTIEEAKDFARFWIRGETCDVWEALLKIID